MIAKGIKKRFAVYKGSRVDQSNLLGWFTEPTDIVRQVHSYKKSMPNDAILVWDWKLDKLSAYRY